MLKVTVLYGHPTSPEEFDNYYQNKHLPLAGTMPNISKVEITNFMPGPDGSAPDYYLMAELYYDSPDAMQTSFDSQEGKDTVADLQNFATGGVKMMIGQVN